MHHCVLFALTGLSVLLFQLESTARGIDVQYSDMPSNTEFQCQVSFPASVVTDVNTIYIPFSLVGQLIVLQARVDSFHGNYIFDTGAERLLLNGQYFSSSGISNTVSALGNTGRVSAVSWHSVDSLSLSQLVIRDLQAHITDLQHIELKKNTRIYGILGYNVFRDFEILIDFPGRLIMLSRVDKGGKRVDTLAFRQNADDSLSFTMRKHLIILETSLNAVKMRMILDTGAELNLLDRRVNRRVLDNFSILKRVNLTGAGHREVEVLAGVLRGLNCGHLQCNDMNTLLTNLDAFNDGLGASAHGVMGYEFLKDKRVMINYQKQKLYFFAPLRP